MHKYSKDVDFCVCVQTSSQHFYVPLFPAMVIVIDVTWVWVDTESWFSLGCIGSKIVVWTQLANNKVGTKSGALFHVQFKNVYVKWPGQNNWQNVLVLPV